MMCEQNRRWKEVGNLKGGSRNRLPQRVVDVGTVPDTFSMGRTPGIRGTKQGLEGKQDAIINGPTEEKS